LREGIDVLCEKPMATNAADARRMADAARSSGRLLAIGMVRRLFPSSRLVADAVRDGRFGALKSVDIFEGGPFSWPVRDGSYFTRNVSGGGVLADIGVHLIDLLHHWLGGVELVSAADDAMGGVDANTLVEMRSGNVQLSMRLSRDWARPNHLTLHFAQATVAWRMDSPTAIDVTHVDGTLTQLTRDANEPADFMGCFREQLERVLALAAGETVTDIATGDDGVRVMDIIDAAYASRRRMEMPWLAATRSEGASG
jgi:predicted dehydrogenase